MAYYWPPNGFYWPPTGYYWRFSSLLIFPAEETADHMILHFNSAHAPVAGGGF
jgi:hypothetical protein